MKRYNKLELHQLKFCKKKKNTIKNLTWISRSARENGRGATGAIWVVNCGLMKLVGGALLKGVACCCCGVLNGVVKPKGLCCCCGWGVWNSDGVCCCCCCCGWGCCEKGVEKSEEPNAGVEGVPNAGVAEGVAKAEEDGWAPNIFGGSWRNPRFGLSGVVAANFFYDAEMEGFEIRLNHKKNTNT